MDASRSGDLWAVGLAPRAFKELEKFKRDKNSFDIVWKKLKELSAGQFTLDNHTAIFDTMPNIPIYKARVSNDLRIIYHVDVVPDRSQEFDRQVIKVLRIEPRAHVDYGLWNRVSAYLYRKYESNEYRNRYPKSSSESNQYFPSKFPHTIHASDAFPTSNGDEDEDIVALTSEGYVPAAKSLFNSTDDEQDPSGDEDSEKESKTSAKTYHPRGRVSLPDPDERQYEIVNHQGATIVIGRSGTGKTTALIHKMESIHRLAVDPIRQLCVTRSRLLARHVESSFKRLARSTTMEFEGANEPDGTQNIFDLNLADVDEDTDLRNDLPPSFSELKKEHFPLFISFDKLCSLIEADIHRVEQKKKREIWSAKPTLEHKFIDY
ncbi:hypothetical protein FRC09_017052, partial [Ceratobasidium sp. 395]